MKFPVTHFVYDSGERDARRCKLWIVDNDGGRYGVTVNPLVFISPSVCPCVAAGA
jgi:hypothetical protein